MLNFEILFIFHPKRICCASSTKYDCTKDAWNLLGTMWSGN